MILKTDIQEDLAFPISIQHSLDPSIWITWVLKMDGRGTILMEIKFQKENWES